ncbi:MAG TPA: hydroxyacid dehydrogenase [Firmicutes bacterium]|nr:hydroxyacid dehydrogenase [Bacillota bacterium]
MRRVLITEKIHPDAEALLRQHFEVVQGSGTEHVAEELRGCEGILVRSAHVTAEDMEKNPQLKVIAKHGMGLDAIDMKAAAERQIAVVNAPYSNLNAVAEHIVMLLLALSKRVVRMDKLTRQGQFIQRNTYKTRELKGATLGIIGMGKISKLVVKKLAGFEMNMISSDPFVTQEDVGDLPVRMTSAEEVYQTSDFVVVHTSLTDSTFHLVGEKEFRMMKNSAYFINAARGAVVDETAMIRALQEGWIAGAGLDVFEQEPPEVDNPLFSMENVIVSPHNAALTDQAVLAMGMDSAQGIIDFLEGRVPKYLCNF